MTNNETKLRKSPFSCFFSPHRNVVKLRPRTVGKTGVLKKKKKKKLYSLAGLLKLQLLKKIMLLPRKQIVVVSWKVFLHIGDFIFYFFISSIPTFSSSFHLRLITASLLHIIKQSEHRRTVEKREDIWFIKKKKKKNQQTTAKPRT